MYAGHVGIALGAHGLRQTVPLWILIVASQLPDWADAFLCVAGAKSTVPGMFTHSIPAVAMLGAGIATTWYVSSRDAPGASILFAVVTTHAIGDYLTGIKPLWPGGPLIGMQLYQRPVIDFMLESAIIFLGWLLYRNSFSADKRSSRDVYFVLVALILIQLAADIVFLTTPGLKKC